MREIDGKAKTIRQLLNGARYAIDYYQREYKWQTKQVQELIDDLTDKFLEDYDPKHPRKEVQKYGHYFLGSIITSDRDGQKFIIDGQQRLTTLTLLLIYLHLRQSERRDRVKLEDLIFSEQYGERSFNLDVEERTPCMDVLYSGKDYELNGAPESIVNIAGRFADIGGLFPEEIDEKALPYFADWLIDNVNLVEITAYSDDDAYLIFETMNDRGLSLSPLDMLKGFILANVGDAEARKTASNTWKKRIGELVQFGKDEDADAVKTWLRSQYAQTIRERKKGAKPGDFDRLGTEFHRWIRDNHESIGLAHSDDFVEFIQRDLDFYTRQYLRLRKAAEKYTPGLEEIYYNARCDFTLQYPLLLASLLPNDKEEAVDRKLRMVATFVDILVARRAVNYLTLSYSAMSYTVFNIMKDIRGKPVAVLAKILLTKLDELDCDFNGTKDKHRNGMQEFALNQWSKRYLFWMLARFTDYIERKSGLPAKFPEYMAGGAHRYEIEHIWAAHPERFKDEFKDENDFWGYRDSIAGLLLLPKKFNASYGDLTYKKKLPHYHGQNLLAKSLHPKCYEHNPGFTQFLKQSGLPFKPCEDFRRNDMDERLGLYQVLAEQIWNPARITEVAESFSSPRSEG